MSTLAQVMACCLTAPSHYLNQCWLIFSKVQWHSVESKLTTDSPPFNHWNKLENYLSKILFKSPRGQWVNIKILENISELDYNQKDHAGAHLNIKMSSYQYWESHYQDKTVSQPSYLHNGNPHTWKDRLYIEMGPWQLRVDSGTWWQEYRGVILPVLKFLLYHNI